MNFWSRKLRQNAALALGLWAAVAVVGFAGWCGTAQRALDFRVFGPSAAAHLPFIVTLGSLLIEGVCLLLALNAVPPAFSLAVPFSLLTVYYIVARVLHGMGLQPDFFYSFFYGMAVYCANIAGNYLGFDRDRRRIRRAFEFYLTPEYIEQLAAEPSKLKLGGETREMTVLFSDIRSFTSLSEKMPPEQLVAFLNCYLTAMSDVIMAQRGVVDKYIGDAIMAFWGAPLENRNHSRDAVTAALGMIEALRQLNDQWRRNGLESVRIGIGINTNRMVVGNMGSERRFNYTVMGDAVNLASRLEGLCKEYGCNLIVNETTCQAVKDAFVVRQLDWVAVKGKSQPSVIFEILGPASERERLEPLVEQTRAGLESYLQGDWDRSIRSWRALAEIDPNHRLTELFCRRCLEMKSNPAQAKEWNGVWRMTHK